MQLKFLYFIKRLMFFEILKFSELEFSVAYIFQNILTHALTT
jgi:hypothetical protein